MLRTLRFSGIALAAVVSIAGAGSAVHAPTIRSTPVRSIPKPTIYVLYSPKARAEARRIKKSLGKDYVVKLYNVRILALADYSGKQKAIAKFSSSDAVIVLGQSAMKPIKRARLRPRVFVVGTAKRSISSTAGLITVLSEGAKSNGLDPRLRVVRHGRDSVSTKKQLLLAEVVLFDKGVNPASTVAHLVRCLVSR